MSHRVSQRQKTPATRFVETIQRHIESDCAEKGTIGWGTLTYLLSIGSDELKVELRHLAKSRKTQQILKVDMRSRNRDLRREAELASITINKYLGIFQAAKASNIGSLKRANPENRMPL